MKVSEVIEKMQSVLDEFGDLEVNIPSNQDEGEYASLESIEVTENIENENAQEVFMD